MDEFVMVPYLMPWEPHPCLGHGMRTFDPFHSQTEAQKAYLYVVATKRYASASSEELREFALDSSRKDKLAERLTYVITAATTALEAIGYDLAARRKMQERVNNQCEEQGGALRRRRHGNISSTFGTCRGCLF